MFRVGDVVLPGTLLIFGKREDEKQEMSQWPPVLIIYFDKI